MGKKDFFNKIHKELSIKYKTPEYFIQYIRSLSLGNKLSLREIAFKTIEIQNRPRKGARILPPPYRTKSKKLYQDLINFLASLNQEKFNDIIQLTRWDKPRRGVKLKSEDK